MSLRGSLETVGLPDVLRLLAMTRKTGELEVTGAEDEGRLWVRDGQLIASDTGRAPNHLDAVFALLRIGTGTFSFDDGVEPAEADEATDIEPLLTEAGIRLTQWPDIEAVVPSLTHVVCMVADAPQEEVIVRADQWRLLAATAGGLPVHEVIDAVKLGDFDGCQALKELVEARLVSIDEPPPLAEPPVVEVMTPIDAYPPVVVAAPFEEALAAVAAAPIEEESFEHGSSFDDGVSFDIVTSPAPASAAESSDYDSEGGIDILPVGSPATAEASAASANGSRPSWSLDDGDDEAMTWTNQSTGTDPAAEMTHEPAADDSAATWTREPATDDSAATWPLPPVEADPLPQQPAYGTGPGMDHTGFIPSQRAGDVQTSVPSPDAPPPGPAADGSEAHQTTEEADEAGDEPINRGLLLKFLSSVRS